MSIVIVQHFICICFYRPVEILPDKPAKSKSIRSHSARQKAVAEVRICTYAYTHLHTCMFKEVKKSIEIFEETQKNQVQTTQYRYIYNIVLYKLSYSVCIYMHTHVICVCECVCIVPLCIYGYTYIFTRISAHIVDLVQRPLVM